MAGRPLRGRGRPGSGYTIWIEDREVIELAILNERTRAEAAIAASLTDAKWKTVRGFFLSPSRLPFRHFGFVLRWRLSRVAASKLWRFTAALRHGLNSTRIGVAWATFSAKSQQHRRGDLREVESGEPPAKGTIAAPYARAASSSPVKSTTKSSLVFPWNGRTQRPCRPYGETPLIRDDPFRESRYWGFSAYERPLAPLGSASVLTPRFLATGTPRFRAGRKEGSGHRFVSCEEMFHTVAVALERLGTIAAIHRAIERGMRLGERGGHRERIVAIGQGGFSIRREKRRAGGQYGLGGGGHGGLTFRVDVGGPGEIIVDIAH